jgi:site-specific recombinase XerD
MWFDRRGRRKYDELTTGKRGEPKIVRESPTYFARYRDADGMERIESTGCRDEQAARQVLADLVKRVEHRKAGILTPEQDRQADFASLPIDDHIAAYEEHLKAKTVRGKRVSAHHRRNVKHQLERIVTECSFKRVGDISREALETWMNRHESEGMAGRTRNTHRAAIVAFCNWCVESGRLSFNPLARLHKADEHGDRRRVRRALAEDEIARLLKAAQLRPIAELGRESIPKPSSERKGRSTWRKAELTFETLNAAYARGLDLLADQPKRIAELTFLGRRRALMYRMMICTGLRKSELASLTVGQVHLDRHHPCAELFAKDEKAGRGAMIPLRTDLVDALHAYIDDLQTRAGSKTLRHDTHLFPMPKDMIRVFDRDLAAASIPKHDPRGRVVDIHALRHTFGTHLARAGVAPRVAMAAMRHSSLELTMNVYTDPALLDVAGAVEALPDFGTSASEAADQPAG